LIEKAISTRPLPLWVGSNLFPMMLLLIFCLRTTNYKTFFSTLHTLNVNRFTPKLNWRVFQGEHRRGISFGKTSLSFPRGWNEAQNYDRSISRRKLIASKKKIYTFLLFARERSLRLDIQMKTLPLKQLLRALKTKIKSVYGARHALLAREMKK
jgi:hypothetical protein